MDLTDKEKYTEQKAIAETTNIKTDGCSEGCAGCGCFLIFAIIIFNIIAWAWGIHWAFGVLLLLFILGVR